MTDRLAVEISASERVRGAVKAHLDYLCQELLANRIEAVEELAEGVEVKVAGETLTLAVRRSPG